jgi:hypothetical protein
MNLDEITIINITENNLIHHINTFVFNLLRGHESLALNYIYIYIWGVGGEPQNLNQPKCHVIWFFFSKEMIVYRLLRDGEDVSGGIVQRNPKSKASVVDHIVGGKGNWWAGTKYISFCNSMDAIMSLQNV